MNNSEKSVLLFAHSHDWGRNAYIQHGQLFGLQDMSSDGSSQVSSIAATMQSVRSFGGY